MNLKIAQAISRFSLYIILAVVLLLSIAIGIGLLCAGLNINPFSARITSLMAALFAGSIGLAAVAMLLNMAVNLSIIADRNSGIFNAEGNAAILKKYSKIYLLVILATALIVIAGTFASRYHYKTQLRQQAAGIIAQNTAIIDKIKTAVISGQDADLNTIPDKLEFLTKQRQDFPGVLLLYSGQYESKTALYQMGYWSKTSDLKLFKKSYYSCRQNLDCEYLNNFFGGKNTAPLQHIDYTRDTYLVYQPFAMDGARFVLLFSKQENYGKLGNRYDSSI